MRRYIVLTPNNVMNKFFVFRPIIELFTLIRLNISRERKVDGKILQKPIYTKTKKLLEFSIRIKYEGVGGDRLCCLFVFPSISLTAVFIRRLMNK